MLQKALIISLLVVLLAGFGCKSKDDKKLPEGDQQITPFVYAPLPPFSKVFMILDYLKLSDFNQAVDEKIFTAQQEIGHSAFALGVLTADGIISVRGHNKTKLNAIAEEMIKISNFLALDESILSLADQLKELISTDQWDELEKALEHYKTEVEGNLYQSKQYDQFTMMQIGGWTEGINRIAWLVNLNFQPEKSTVLMQKGTLNHLIKNMEYVKTPSIKDSYYFKTTYDKLLEVKKIIDAAVNDTYTKEQVDQLMVLSQAIKNLYTK